MTRYAIVTREFLFEASHHEHRPHGDAYRLQISLRIPVISAPSQSPDVSEVMDIEDLEHRVNRGLFPGVCCGGTTCGGSKQERASRLASIHTTAEHLVHCIWDALVAAGVPDHLLHCIRLWETEKEWVEITHQERETVYTGFE